MSRIGIKPVSLPSGVEVKVNGSELAIKGSKGATTLALNPVITAEVDGSTVKLGRKGDDKAARALHGTSRALLQNAVVGVSEGYTKKLEIVGVGYRAQLQGKKLVLNIGFCHTVEIDAPEGITFACPDANHIDVAGIDKQAVGQTAAEIRAVRKPEPYKGKGIRYVDEIVRRKAGKSSK